MDLNDQMAVYRSLVRRVIRERAPMCINNSSPEHATVLIDELIRSAVSTVDIYCKRMSADVWGAPSVVDAVRHAIDARVTFRIVAKEQVERHETSVLLSKYSNAAFRIYAQDGLPLNVLIVDKEMFRVEPNDGVREGFAYAKCEEMAATANALFEKVWYLGTDVKVKGPTPA